MACALDESAIIRVQQGALTGSRRIKDGGGWWWRCLLEGCRGEPLKERCKVEDPGATEDTAEQAASPFACC